MAVEMYTWWSDKLEEVGPEVKGPSLVWKTNGVILNGVSPNQTTTAKNEIYAGILLASNDSFGATLNRVLNNRYALKIPHHQHGELLSIRTVQDSKIENPFVYYNDSFGKKYGLKPGAKVWDKKIGFIFCRLCANCHKTLQFECLWQDKNCEPDWNFY